MRNPYRRIAEWPVQVLLFRSTWSRKPNFAVLLGIKSKFRLHPQPQNDLRCYFTKLFPPTDELVAENQVFDLINFGLITVDCKFGCTAAFLACITVVQMILCVFISNNLIQIFSRNYLFWSKTIEEAVMP